MKRDLMWEQWEDAVIRRDYCAHGWMVVHRNLPHRTKGAITSRAALIGVQGLKSRQKRTKRPPLATGMTPAEIAACQLLRDWRGPVNMEPMRLRA